MSKPVNRTVLAVGAAIAAALLGVLSMGLGQDPQRIDSPLVGKPAPEFTLRTVSGGNAFGPAKFRGKPVVVNFWATWCRPCWDEHPTLTQAARTLGDRVQFIGVVFQDEESKIQSFLEQRGAGYPTVVDERGKTAIAYGVGGIPETFFLDATGRIVAKHDGPLSPEQLNEYVTKAMNP
jgi:cytochrome c biogenesis protein CcmG, thiol:disulfide interchange protein DsbE